MRKITSITIVISFLICCVRYPKSIYDVLGHYKCLQKNSGEYVDFLPNNIYLHFKLMDGDTLYKYDGSWKLLNNNGGIYLSNWSRIDATGKVIQTTNHSLISLSNNTLTFSADDYKKNFKKVEN